MLVAESHAVSYDDLHDDLHAGATSRRRKPTIETSRRKRKARQPPESWVAGLFELSRTSSRAGGDARVEIKTLPCRLPATPVAAIHRGVVAVRNGTVVADGRIAVVRGVTGAVPRSVSAI